MIDHDDENGDDGDDGVANFNAHAKALINVLMLIVKHSLPVCFTKKHKLIV